LDAILNNWSHL